MWVFCDKAKAALGLVAWLVGLEMCIKGMFPGVPWRALGFFYTLGELPLEAYRAPEAFLFFRFFGGRC